MLKTLNLTNVGPAQELQLVLGNRLNIITGDNGLGKSFLLDIAWWTLTRKWPSEINRGLTAGKRAMPYKKGESRIQFSVTGEPTAGDYESIYIHKEQAWTGRQGRPINPGLVLYALADGSFAVWDPARNSWQTSGGVDIQERRPAYVFSPNEVWDGLASSDGSWLCNGLIRDWAGWQKEKGTAFEYLTKILKVLSPSGNEQLKPGDLTRISLDDARDIPTIRMPYSQDVPVLHASSGMRRIMALAYFLVWAWEEHKQAAKQLHENPANQIVFLIDEIESHLHPNWQKTIIPALLSVMNSLTKNAEVQLITATHSPLIMASVEPIFSENTDAWFDLDLEGKTVVLKKRAFEKHGNVDNWLGSEAFDLKSSRALDYEKMIAEATALMDEDKNDIAKIRKMNERLVEALSPSDDFLFNWRYIGKKKGWFE